MQALDAHSTYSALRHSNVVEMNPLMKGISDNTATLVAVKAGRAQRRPRVRADRA